jgi:hypothetical protein
LNEKNRLLEKQEDLLYEEHDKFVRAQNSLALEVKRNEVLSCELSTCHESISSLKSINDDLSAKLEIANKSISCVEHVVICNRCKDFNVEACSEHLVSISKLNDEVASLNAQLKTSKNEFDKLKFARDAYIIGRHPSIKDGLGFKSEAKNLTSHKAPISAKEKGKAPMTSSNQKNHAFIYSDRKFSRNACRNYSYDSHAMIASSSCMHGRNMAMKDSRNVHYDRSCNAFNSHVMIALSSNFNGRSRKNVMSHAPRKVYDGSTTVFHAYNAKFIISCKNKKVIAKKVGAKCKGDKTCIWVPKTIVTNLVGPNKSWVPKTQA